MRVRRVRAAGRRRGARSCSASGRTLSISPGTHGLATIDLAARPRAARDPAHRVLHALRRARAERAQALRFAVEIHARVSGSAEGVARAHGRGTGPLALGLEPGAALDAEARGREIGGVAGGVGTVRDVGGDGDDVNRARREERAQVWLVGCGQRRSARAGAGAGLAAEREDVGGGVVG
jgi:hypothetical protein